MTPEDITGAAGLGPKRRLAGKFTEFRRVMKMDTMPEFAAMSLQGSYIAGAQACFQILQAASKESAEDAIVIWGELQTEILTAMPKRERPIVEVVSGMKM